MSESAEGSATERDLTATTADGPISEAGPLSRSSVGESVGRYVVLGEVGHGAMGRVLRAYDPKLQREVALKEVRGGTLSTEGTMRLVAEARAMAKLSHPNVVGVFDVEEIDDRVVLVMEYVAGDNLRAWVRAEERGWSALVSVFVQAGRGLAAAHAADLLHRDFKPDNVLVGDGGVVKVTDFGLAKVAPESSASLSGSLDGESTDVDTDLTQAGTVMGTPRYMAPEQHRASPLTASADQYAFCTALWEALWGSPPFPVRGFEALAKAKLAGPPTPPGGSEVPRSIVEAITRGLAPMPKDRWPSMDPLLEALRWDPAKQRRRWLRAVAGIAVVGLVAAVWSLRSSADVRCAGAEQQLDDAWGSTARARARSAVEGIGASYATTVWNNTAAALDRYAADWVDMHTEACEATTLRGEQSSEVMDLRMACLRRARVELMAVTHQLAEADADVVSRAHALVAGLRPLERCSDVDALRADVEPPHPQEREAVDRAKERLAAARAATSAGRHAQAKAHVDAARAALSGVEYGPVRTELWLVEGHVLEELGEYAAAEEVLEQAVRSAGQHWQRAELSEAAGRVMFVIGVHQQRMAEGLRYRPLAEGLAVGDPVREAQVLANIGDIFVVQGKYAEAEDTFRRALTLLEAALGSDSRGVANGHNSLANALSELGRYDEAEAEYRRSLALWERVLGPEHPDVAATRNNLANLLADRGRFAEAEAEHREVLRLRAAALGPEHPATVQSRYNLANVLVDVGRYDEAKAEFSWVLARREVMLDPQHPDIAQTLNGLANILVLEGDYAKTEQLYRRALAIWEAALGPEHRDSIRARNNLAMLLYMRKRFEIAEQQMRRVVELTDLAMGSEHPEAALSRDNLGLVLTERGDFEGAEAEHRRAIEIGEVALGLEHPQVVSARSHLASVLLETGRYELALQHARWVWGHRQGEEVPGLQRAESAFTLARAMIGTDSSPETKREANALAEQAVAGFSEFGETYREYVAEVRTWQRLHGLLSGLR